jgi:hypothetical protein
MFKLYFLTSVADVVASVTLNYDYELRITITNYDYDYELIRNSLEFENLFFLFKN